MVRHHLVQRIIRAYDEHKTRVAEQQLSLLEAKNGDKANAVAEVREEHPSMPPQEVRSEE